MNATDQIKAIAELDGWTYHKSPMNKTTKLDMEWDWFVSKDKQTSIETLPNYLHSYDAIIPVIQKLSYAQLIEIKAVTLFYLRSAYEATPSQLCEALLRTTGKWKE